MTGPAGSRAVMQLLGGLHPPSHEPQVLVGGRRSRVALQLTDGSQDLMKALHLAIPAIGAGRSGPGRSRTPPSGP